MSTIARRVVLLARPGAACDRLRGALADAGAELVLEADPLTLDPATLDAAQAQVVLVALDTQTEDALDRFDACLHNPAIEVIFEEAELAARREGWEAARWVRHLASKLHRHGDVLPPGSGAAEEDATTQGAAAVEWIQGTSELAVATDAADALSVDSPAVGAEAVVTAHEFDPLFGEITVPDAAPTVGSDSEVLLVDPSAAFDPSLDYSYDGDFDSISLEMPAEFRSPVIAETNEIHVNVEPGALATSELTLELETGGATSVTDDPGFDAMFSGDFSPLTFTEADGLEWAPAAGGMGGDADSAPESAPDPSRRVLELVSTDDAHAPAHAADGPEVDHRFRHDLASLESRIAGMELVVDHIVKGPAQANGAVLVIAGIGGPDAVRQLLGALPEDFPRPVLVQQRLDGGRYDKLVAQMQRATAIRVRLAEPGLPAIAGVIYILPGDITIKVTDMGIEFIAGDDDVLAQLPSADSAVLLLSGSDPAQVDAVMTHSWAGALVSGQSPDGCYDAEAPNALLARGGGSGQPAELAERLSARWRS